MKTHKKLESLKISQHLFNSAQLKNCIAGDAYGYYTATENGTNNAKNEVCEMDSDYAYDHKGVCNP